MSPRALHLLLLAVLVAVAFGLSSSEADSASTQAFVLTVSVSGPGTVTGPGINCPGDCTESYSPAFQVTLTASPASSFVSWGGDGICSGTQPTCSFTMTSSHSVSATFREAATQRLNVEVAGPGTVTGPGINCPGDCGEDYPTNASVTLSASPSSGASFSGWGFDCTTAGGAPTCTLTMNSSKLARASFGAAAAPTTRRLEVSVTGTGSVTGPGINCPGDCSEDYPAGASVSLNASPGSGFTFGSWGGDCASAGTTPSCTLSMSANRSASATMSVAAPTVGDQGGSQLPPILPKPSPSLAAQISGNGTLIVSLATRGSRSAQASSASPINCGVSTFRCFAKFKPAQPLKVTAKAAPGYIFQGWSGACSGRQTTCRFTLSASSTVSATFGPRGGAKVAMTARRPNFSVRWRESVGRGRLVIAGRVSSGARLKIAMRRPSGGALITRGVAVPGGAFSVPLDLRPGRLAGGARLFPGGFVVSLQGTSRGLRLPLNVRTTVLIAPREGVVRNAFVSPTETGAATLRLPAGVKEAWARFRFEVQPRAGTPLSVRWFWPDGRPLGAADKSNRPEVASFIRSTTALPTGAWRAELWAGNRIVQRLRVRIG